MTMCGACYWYRKGECLEYGYEVPFEDDVNCKNFAMTDRAKEILIEHKKEMYND